MANRIQITRKSRRCSRLLPGNLYLRPGIFSTPKRAKFFRSAGPHRYFPCDRPPAPTDSPLAEPARDPGPDRSARRRPRTLRANTNQRIDHQVANGAGPASGTGSTGLLSAIPRRYELPPNRRTALHQDRQCRGITASCQNKTARYY